MTTKVKVNVMVRKVKWRDSKGYYTGKFTYQQVDPLDTIYVKKNGDVRANLAADDVDIEYNWVSTAVEINDQLYDAHPINPPEKSIWIVAGNGKPKFDDNPPLGGDEIVVTPGDNGDALVLKDKNALNKHYTYCFAVRVGIDGGQWLVDDPKITNKGTNRFFSLQSECAS